MSELNKLSNTLSDSSSLKSNVCYKHNDYINFLIKADAIRFKRSICFDLLSIFFPKRLNTQLQLLSFNSGKKQKLQFLLCMYKKCAWSLNTFLNAQITNIYNISLLKKKKLDNITHEQT